MTVASLHQVESRSARGRLGEKARHRTFPKLISVKPALTLCGRFRDGTVFSTVNNCNRSDVAHGAMYRYGMYNVHIVVSVLSWDLEDIRGDMAADA